VRAGGGVAPIPVARQALRQGLGERAGQGRLVAVERQAGGGAVGDLGRGCARAGDLGEGGGQAGGELAEELPPPAPEPGPGLGQRQPEALLDLGRSCGGASSTGPPFTNRRSSGEKQTAASPSK
jgi:hypothetical protein